MMASTSLPRTPRTPVTPRSPFVNRGRQGDMERSPSRDDRASRTSSLRQSTFDSSALISTEAAAEAAEAASKAALEEIERDEIFSKFLDDDFNATQFASEVLSSGSAAASCRKLNDGISVLERQLRSEVVLRHDELLQQLASLRDTESVLAVVRAGVDSLQASVQRVRSEIADPYKQIKVKTRQLASLHDTMEVLRSVLKLLKQVKRLKDHMSSGSQKVELAKAAQLFSEIEGIRKESDLSGLAVVEAELPWLGEVGQQIRSEALSSLERGMEARNQAEVGSVLQVFYNLGELGATVEVLVNRFKLQATKAVTTALDMKAISAAGALGGAAGGMPGGVSRSGTPALGAAPRARDALWQRLQQCIESLHTILLATWHLQRVLAKKRDPISHMVFLDEVVKKKPGELLPTEKVWEALIRAFASQLKAAFTGSSFVKETFVSGYPRLLAAAEGLLQRLASDTDVKGGPPAVRPEDRTNFIGALEPFQSAYLGQSHVRLTELVNSLLPAGWRGGIPPVESVGRFVGRLQEEVEVVKAHPQLTLLVLRGVGKALQLLAERAEYQVNVGSEARQVTAPANSLQQRNAALCVLLQEVHAQALQLFPLPPGAEDALAGGLNAIHALAASAITPLFTAMVERVESCLLLMHEERFDLDDAAGDSGSEYMETTLRAISHFRAEFLSPLVPQISVSAASALTAGVDEPICTGLARRMASRVLLFFVRHAALVRPLSEAGKLRLARDMGELEFAVGQHIFPVEPLGPPYRALRAFRPLLFLETNQLASSSLLQDILPSAILHHLFSRAPPELESPLRRNNLTPARYSLWLDRHTEEEAWKEVRASLDAYARTVRTRGDKEFSPIYPLMLELGEAMLGPTPLTRDQRGG
eukprot:TRINITY_DN22545_c0_g1_i1.p1 TRINITY_DN22545_c0_g1~~TRINITY_DN22545_c0_g1_i1.p1  ORF type:complete len:876 (+),score=237.99 TRINITY_DN22545_c0_g1_i1:407-3034(+)